MGDEELGTFGMLSGGSHPNDPFLPVMDRGELGANTVVKASVSIPTRATALDHKIRHHTVVVLAVKKTILSQLHKVGNSAGGLLRPQHPGGWYPHPFQW